MSPSRLRSGLRATALLLGAAILCPAAAQAAIGGPTAVPGEVIVRFAAETDGSDRAALRDRADVDLKRQLPVSDLQLVKAQSGQSAADAAAQLERSPEVVYAELNQYRGAAATPSDSYFHYLWGSSNTGQDAGGESGTPGSDINASDAWDVTTGSPDVTTAVIDSGVDTNHPDLASQIWANPGESGGGRESNRVDDDRNGFVDDVRGWDFVQGDNDPGDAAGHGTHVAGTIAAAGNNSLGVAGVSWSSRVLPLRVLDGTGQGTVAGLISAYRYAAVKGVRIVNLSLTGSSFSNAERDAIAAAPNTLFVAAAGNGGSDGAGDDNDSAPQYPCAYPLPNIVCVAASDQRDGRASFSNYGRGSVDIAAPGVNILSTIPGGGYAFYRGTSMATPQVSGVASLIWSVRPSESVADVKAGLLGGADSRPAFAGVTVSGGRLNANRSVRQQYERAPVPATSVTSTKAAPVRRARRTPPRLYLKVNSRRRLRSIVSGGLPITTRCSKRCRVTLKILVKTRARGRVKGKAAARTRLAAQVTVTLSTRGKRIVVKLSRDGRKLLKKLERVNVTVSAVAADAGGTSKRHNVAVALRR